MLRMFEKVNPPRGDFPSKSQLVKLKPGDEVEISTPSQDYLCVVQWVGKTDVLAYVRSVTGDPSEGPPDLVAFRKQDIQKVIPKMGFKGVPKYAILENRKSGELFVFHSQHPAFIGKLEVVPRVRIVDVWYLTGNMEDQHELLEDATKWAFYFGLQEKRQR